MPKSAQQDLVNRISRLLVKSQLGIVGVRHDITETEALELIQRLEDEVRELRPVEEIGFMERPTPPQNQMVLALMNLKHDPWRAAIAVRRGGGIPEGQMLTRRQMDELIVRLHDLPTIPGKEEEVARLYETVLQDFGWAARVR